jgi:MFS transporter, SP family, sugar:H+ symporter
VTFATPYLLANPGPNLGPKIGWIFAAAGYLSGFFGIFHTPELMGRSLEEVDELFEANLWAWQFKGYETTGAAHRLTQIENRDMGLESEEQKGDDRKETV